MDANALFTMALGLSSPWEVKELVFTAESRRLDIRIDFPRGSSFRCPECGEASKVHDTEEKSWRHLDFFQHSAYLTARVPRCRCDQHGVKQVQVPWARPGSGFTLLFEALLMALMREMPVNAVARIVGEHDTRLWRLVDHHVEEARQRLDMSQVKAVAVDETAARRGQDYVSLFMDLDLRRLLFGTAGNDQSTVQAFRKDLEAHGGSAERITEACCDMSQAFILGMKAQFPSVHLTFDRFHVMQLANKAVDDVRRVEARERPELKRSRYVWLKNRSNLSARQRGRLQELQHLNLKTAEAYRMRLTLQDFYEQANPKAAAEFLADWCEMVLEAGLEPMKKVARTLMEHAEGVLRWFWSGFSNGLLEGINSLIQAAKAKARGYRTTRNLLNIAYLIAGKLDFALPAR
jgi:transposase